MIKEHNFAFHNGWPVSVHKIENEMAEVSTFDERKMVPVSELLSFNKTNVKAMEDKYNKHIGQCNIRLHAIHDFLNYCPDGEAED